MVAGTVSISLYTRVVSNPGLLRGGYLWIVEPEIGNSGISSISSYELKPLKLMGSYTLGCSSKGQWFGGRGVNKWYKRLRGSNGTIGENSICIFMPIFPH